MSSIEKLEQFDVIVIGAGVSGATAAYTLKKQCKDLKILIIEGKDRVGGRTHTIELKTANGKKTKFDAGGQWVTDTQQIITQLITELGLETYGQFDSGTKILEYDGKVTSYNSSIPKISIPSLVQLFYKILQINSTADKINTMNPFENLNLATRLDSTNLEQYLSLNSMTAATKAILMAAIRVVYGLELNQINTLFGLMYVKSGGSIERLTLVEKGCAQEKRLKGGTQQISQKMIDYVLKDSNCKLLLNTALLEVIQNQNLVEILTENTLNKEKVVFNAKKVISSIPINQYINVNFKPELPYFKRNCFKFMQMGNYIKFIVTYKQAFWQNKGLSGESVSDGSILSKSLMNGNQINFHFINL
jgi:monoamine oxidase